MSQQVDASLQEYKLQFWCWGNFFQFSAICVTLGTGIYALLKSLHGNLWGVGAGIGLILAGCFFLWLLWFYCKTKISVTGGQLILKRPNTTIATSWKDIRRIEEAWGFYSGDRSYFVRTPHGTIGIPDTIERCEELLTIIQERSGKRIISEWRGAKDTIREDWFAFMRWIQTHRAEFIVIILIIGTVITLATRWAINEYRSYHP
jgi:hypothetical protein